MQRRHSAVFEHADIAISHRSNAFPGIQNRRGNQERSRRRRSP
ncbi:MAG: hypothetical protein R3F11_10175 [Verrucomicrobiales bacterium]